MCKPKSAAGISAVLIVLIVLAEFLADHGNISANTTSCMRVYLNVCNVSVSGCLFSVKVTKDGS